MTDTRRPLTRTEEGTMLYLRIHGETTLAALAEYFRVTESGMKTRLGPLRMSGYVTRRGRGTDSRWKAT